MTAFQIVRTFKRTCIVLVAVLAFSVKAGTVIPIDTPIPNDTPPLTVDEVRTIIGQAVGFLKKKNESGVISVVDREGHILGIFRMTLSGTPDFRINEQATAKARTAAFFQSDENAFTTRTAQFIVQGNFPPNVRNLDAGPLFGVPFSNFPGTDIQTQVPPFIAFVPGLNAANSTTGAPAAVLLPPGNRNARPNAQPLVITPLTDDFGGVPLYKNGKACGGIGVEVDGFGMIGGAQADKGGKRVDSDPRGAIEEAAALAGQKGFAPKAGIRANKILINGFRFPYTKANPGRSTPVTALEAEGSFEPYFDTAGTERNAAGGLAAVTYPVDITTNGNKATAFGLATAQVMAAAARGTPAQEFPRRGFVPRFPPRASPLGTITIDDVRQVIQQGADAANRTKAGIRNPKGTAEEVWISVVDLNGTLLASFRTEDATPFSFDVHVQKARTAAFFSNDEVGFSSRGVGFMAQTFYPPGVEESPGGPLSGLFAPGNVDPSALPTTLPTNSGRLSEISQLLINDDGTPTLNITDLNSIIRQLGMRLPRVRDQRICALQAGITVDLSLRALTGGPATTIPNGITVFAGGVPMYKNGLLVGGIGISGGGIDQDDYIAFFAQRGFEPPPGVFCDQASDAKIINALKQATAKLKVQFPNLTNGTDAVIDVVQQQLDKGPQVLRGLRIPYVKFPREPVRK